MPANLSPAHVGPSFFAASVGGIRGSALVRFPTDPCGTLCYTFLPSPSAVLHQASVAERPVALPPEIGSAPSRPVAASWCAIIDFEAIAASALAGGDRMQFDHLKRREFIALLGGAAAAWPLAAPAQQAGKTYRIGWLQPGPIPEPWVNGFRQGLPEFNYVEGKKLII